MTDATHHTHTRRDTTTTRSNTTTHTIHRHNLDTEQDIINCASEGIRRYGEETAIAQWMKRELDRKHGPVWHVVVGHEFGSYVSHNDTQVIFFFIESLGFLVWRTKGPVSPEYIGPPP